MAQVIQLRRDYSSNWTAVNPVLAQGEMGVQLDNNYIKIGNGVSSWNQLPFGAGGSPSGGGEWTVLTTNNGTDIIISTASNTNTLYHPAFITTYAAGGGQVDISAGGSSNALASIVFNNASGVSFGLNGSTITASVKTDYQSSGNYLTTAMQSNLTSVFQYTSDNSLSLGTGYTSHTHSDLYINTSLSNNFQLTSDNSLSLGTGYTTHTHAYQSTGNYLTTAAQVSHNHGSISIQPVTGNTFTYSSLSDGMTLSMPAWITTYAGAAASWELEGNNTAGTTSASYDRLYLSGGQNVTLEGNSNTIIVNVNATGAQDGGNILAVSGSTAASTGTIAFWNANNMSFGFSDSTRITGSFSQSTHDHPYLNTSEPHIREINVTNGSYSNNTLNLRAHSNITLSADGASIKFSVADAIPLANSTAYNSTVLSSAFQTTGNYLTTAAQSVHTHEYQSTGNYLTTAAISNHTHSDLYINTSISGNFQLTADNSLSLGTGYTTHTHDYAATNHTHSIVNQINGSSGSISFNVGSSLSSSVNVSAITFGLASNITTALQSANANYLTNQSAEPRIISFNGTSGSITFNAGSYASLSNNGSAFTLNVTGLQATSATSAITANALNTSQSSLFQHTSATSAITSNALNTSQSSLFQLFANSTLSLGTGYTTHTHQYQSTGNYLTTAAQVSHTHGDISISGVNLSASTASASNGMTLTLSVAAPGVAAENNYINLYGNTSAGSTASGSSILLSAGNNITLAVSEGSIKIEGGGGAGGTSIVPGSYLSSSLDGSTLSLSVTGLQATSATSAITASAVNTSILASLQYTSNTSAITGSAMNTSERVNYFYTSNNTFLTTAAQVSHSHGNPTLSLVNLTGATASASNGLTLSITGPTAGNVYYSDNARATWSSSVDGVSSSIYITSLGAGGGVALSASNSLYSSGTVVLSGSTNVTVSYNGNTILLSAGGGGVALQGSGTYTQNTGTVQFSNANGLSFGLTAGTMTGSVANTGSIYFVNSNGHSWSSSTEASKTSFYIYTA